MEKDDVCKKQVECREDVLTRVNDAKENLIDRSTRMREELVTLLYAVRDEVKNSLSLKVPYIVFVPAMIVMVGLLGSSFAWTERANTPDISLNTAAIKELLVSQAKDRLDMKVGFEKFNTAMQETTLINQSQNEVLKEILSRVRRMEK